MLWLSSMLENLVVDALVCVFIIRELCPVDRLVLADGSMDDGELGIEPHLVHLPLLVTKVVIREGLLGVLIAVWQLEDLSVQILLLLRYEKRDLRPLNVLCEDIDRILRELKVFQLLLLEFTLLHVDHLGQEVMVTK